MFNVMKRIGSLGVIGLLALGLIGATQAQSLGAGSATPGIGLAGTNFAIVATGFMGSTQDADEDNSRGERASYWVNTPGGGIISVETLAEADSEGRTTRPLITTANTDGRVAFSWLAPKDLVAGDYSIVIHGLSSQYEAQIFFAIAPQGSQTVIQTTVVPPAAPVGTTFQFVATGYVEERVSYWINTPSGAVISTEPRDQEDDEDAATTRPLQDQADEDGKATVAWTAPAGLVPGAYSMVIHGLTSQHEVQIFFTIS